MSSSAGQYQGNLQYAVDIVLCIDATASMTPVLDSVKESALTFQQRLETVMHEKGKAISQLRVRSVVFRDFGDNEDDAVETTDFLTLPEQAEKFRTFLSGVEAQGGGDRPESGLEALALAVDSAWETGLDRRRHVIVMFTDAPAHPLGGPHSALQSYPAAVPRSADELFERWGYSGSQLSVMEQSAKRLVLFAPDEEPWNDMQQDWDMTLHFPSKAGHGLQEFEMDEIIDTIANSL
ncbi:vWA domain-containing protein [Streptomyces nigrescens]